MPDVFVIRASSTLWPTTLTSSKTYKSSLDVKLMVTMSPALAKVVTALLEAILTLLIVGDVSSYVTSDPAVIAVA